MTDQRYKGYLLAATAAALWAMGALMAKWLFSRSGLKIDPLHLSAARAYLAFLVLLGFLLATNRAALRVGLRDLPFLALFGVFGLALLHFTYFKAIEATDVATAILLQYLAPVLVLVVSVLFLGERFTWYLPAAVALSVLGCSLMVGVLGARGLVVTRDGIFWGLVAAVFFSVYMVMGKMAASRFSPWTLALYGLAAASLFWLVIQGGPAAVAGILTNWSGLAAALCIAVVSTVIPFGIFLSALRYIDATKAGVTATLEPAVAGIGAYLLFGELLTALQLVGGAFVLAAILLVQLGERPRPVQVVTEEGAKG